MNAWIEVELVTDACFSSGAAGRPGDVDTDVEHNPMTGLPTLRGRTLKGLLVEETALVLSALEPGGEGPWHDAAGALFGVPGASHEHEANLRIGDGYLPRDLVEAVERATAKGDVLHRWSPVAVRAALTTIRRQTRVDHETGAPDRGSLRATRLLRAGLSFRHPVVFRRAPSASERAVLAAAAVSLRRAGLHRNRGWGRVQLRILDEQNEDWTTAWLMPLAGEQAPAPEQVLGSPRVASPSSRSFPHNPARREASGRRVVSYRLVLEAPLVLSSTGGDPNAVDTLRFVSGASVLGAMARRFLSSGGCADDDAFRRLFLTGETRWLHAYPEGRDQERLAPAPLSLEWPKDARGTGTVHDRIVEGAPECRPLPAWFVALEPDGDELRYREAARSARMHHARDRQKGRPTDESIFAYVSLDAGERFVGHILCEDGADTARVEALLAAGPLHLGRSRTATYGGGARVEALSTKDADTWCEVCAAEDPDEDWLVVTLLSDYLGRDGHGQSSPRALVSELGRALGWPSGVPLERAFLGSRAVSGYVSKWQMPRPRHTAVSAGSVLVFHGAPVADAERLRELAWQGLGERRAEGFGRVAVGWHGARSTFRAGPVEPRSPARPRAPLAPASKSFSVLRASLVRDAVRAHLCRRGEQDGGAVHPEPSPALVSRLRSRIRTARSAGELASFLLDLKGKVAGRSLERARRGAEPLSQWMHELLALDEGGAPAWWHILLVDEQVVRPLGLGLGELPEEARWPLLQIYLDTLCEMLRRRAQRPAQRAEAR